MNIECQQCGSMQFKKVSLVYTEGLSDLNARSRGWGLLLGSGGADLGFGSFRTKGEIQTRLSQRVSPPRKWSYWKIVLGGLIGLIVLEFLLGYIDTFLRVGENFNRQLTVFGYTWIGAIAVILCMTFRHNVWTMPKRRRLWDRSFMCRRCGCVLQRLDPGGAAHRKLNEGKIIFYAAEKVE